MKTYLAKRWYTNFILTVIATLLAFLVLAQYGVRWQAASPAYAQETPSRLGGFASPGKSAPVDTSNVATVQDLAVAGATSEVASANREIAAAIRDLAKAVQDLGTNLQRALSTPKPASAGSESPQSDIRVEVGR